MRVRLRAGQRKDGKPVVDRTGHGRINGLSVATKGVAKGHGFELDDKSLDLIAAQLADNGRGRWTHGALCADALGQHLGRWENLRRAGDHVVGDFVFSALGHRVQPEGLSVNAPTYLMDAAESEPDAAGVSVVLELGEFDHAKDARGELLRDTSGEPRRFARPLATPRADFVADPAANPDGLLAPTGLSEATTLLDQAAKTHGARNVRAALHAWLQATTDEETTMPCKTCGKSGADCACAKPEAEKPKADAPEAAMSAKLSAAEQRALAAEKKLAEFEAAEKARLEREDSGYLEHLRTASAEAQSPIEAAKLGKVEALLKAGQRDTARIVGDALLEVSLAKKQTKTELRHANGLKDGTQPPPPAVGVDGAKALLEAQGYSVALSEDGTKITGAAKRSGKA